MLLQISHSTTYHYDRPVPYGLQELRLTPQSGPGQQVLSWETNLTGAHREVSFKDEYANVVELVSIAPGTTEATVIARGEIETTDTGGVVPRHRGHAPLWLFQRSTELTKPGKKLRDLLEDLPEHGDVQRLHDLSALVLERVAYQSGSTGSESTAEEAIAAGYGVCQDHSHIFIAGARELGYPARYVSGYLMMDDRPDQEASHAWAQAWVDGLGWVGFDVSNGISPDDRYVEVATGLDYRAAAPISGVRFGPGTETLQVSVQVQQ